MSDTMARSAASLTDSDAAPLASSRIPSAAQLTLPVIRPTARSRARRRYFSTAARTLGSLAHRKAVRLGTLFSVAHAVDRHALAIARASWVFRAYGDVLRTCISAHVIGCTRWQDATAPPFGPAHGSQPGAQAGRHALEGQKEVGRTGSTLPTSLGSTLRNGGLHHPVMARRSLCRGNRTIWHSCS